MRREDIVRLFFSAVLSALCVHSLLLLSVSCERQPSTVAPAKPYVGGTGAASEVSAGDGKKPWPAELGSITGVIRVAGNTPAMPPLDMSSTPRCVELHSGEPPRLELIVAGENRGLRDVFVYISRGLETYEIPPVTPAAAVLDQKGCVYTPRVFGVRVGQDVRIRNSDPLLHNVKVTDSRPINEGMPGVGEILKKKWFRKAQLGVSFRCELHPWMRAYACVVDHPCYDVSDGGGRFRIEKVPPGRYTVDFWHERAPGLGKPGSLEVEVKAGQEARVDASF